MAILLFFSVLAVEAFEETLETWKKKNSVNLDFEMVRNIFIRICYGVRECYSNEIAHGNLTQQNIIIFSNIEPPPEPWHRHYLDDKYVIPKIAPFFRHGRFFFSVAHLVNETE